MESSETGWSVKKTSKRERRADRKNVEDKIKIPPRDGLMLI